MRVAGRPMSRVMPRDRQRRPDGRPFIDLRPGERPSERRPVVSEPHVPVMVQEVLHHLAPRPSTVIVDATLGAGGHAEAILRSVGGDCTFVGVDRDPAALDWAAHRLSGYGDSVRLVSTTFDDLPRALRAQGLPFAHGVLFDFGMSSMQVDEAARGFSFRRPGPLDMRMDPSSALTAADVVNGYPERELVRILREYGEERHASRVARAITGARRRRPLRSTDELAAIVLDAYPGRSRAGTHPARRTFQAIRMEVNDELGMIERALRSLPGVLAPGGRVVVLSYHSLEDRLTKRIFQELSSFESPLPGLPPPTGHEPKLKVLTRGAVLPSESEIERNPRASSARLRAAERLVQ